MSVPLVIYHSPCADGFTAAWACWNIHPDWEYFSAEYTKPITPDNGVDVSDIAKKFGGGGHKHAAGFRTRIPFNG